MLSTIHRLRIPAALSSLLLCAAPLLAQAVPVDPIKEIKQPDLNPVKPIPQLLKLSSKKLKELTGKLQEGERAFLVKLKAPGMTKVQKREATSAHLEERIRVSEQMLEEFQFVKGKLDATVGAVSRIVGQQGKNSAIADKASKAMSEIGSLKKGILDLQREARAWGPEPTDETWDDWYAKTSAGKKKLRKLFRDLQRQSRRQKLYAKISAGFQMSKKQMMRWRMSVARLSELWEVRLEKVQDEVDMSKDVLGAVGAQQAFDDLESLATFGKEMDGMIAGLTSGGIWDEVLTTDLMTVSAPSADFLNSVSTDMGFDLLEMDPDEFLKQQDTSAAAGDGEGDSSNK